MPVVLSNPLFPYQVGPNGSQAYVQQLNYQADAIRGLLSGILTLIQ